MIRLMFLEFGKLARRPRSYLGYLGVLLLIGPTMLALHQGNPERMFRNQAGSGFEIIGSFCNALFLARTLMEPAMAVFIPLFVSLIAGDMVSGEEAEGTLRVLLVRPVSRAAVLSAKYAVALLHAATIPLFLLLAALSLGGIFFGYGDMLTPGDGIVVYPQNEALARLFGATLTGALGMGTIAAVAFLLSVLTRNSNGAIIGAMMLLIISGTVGQIPYFERIQPYLFTTHLGAWRLFFEQAIPWKEIAQAAAWHLSYITLCFLAALSIFQRKDILS